MKTTKHMKANWYAGMVQKSSQCHATYKCVCSLGARMPQGCHLASEAPISKLRVTLVFQEAWWRCAVAVKSSNHSSQQRGVLASAST